jgi:hypothetical protein
LKVDRELQDAVEKHGTVKVPRDYEDQFFERINKKKEEFKNLAV